MPTSARPFTRYYFRRRSPPLRSVETKREA
jgi:hypothetical protein